MRNNIKITHKLFNFKRDLKLKITDIIAERKAPFFTFEIIPPMRGQSVKEVINIVEKLVPYNPGWIDVTSHPAGRLKTLMEQSKDFENVQAHHICGIIKKVQYRTMCSPTEMVLQENEDALID